jgi:hypothetical protein
MAHGWLDRQRVHGRAGGCRGSSDAAKWNPTKIQRGQARHMFLILNRDRACRRRLILRVQRQIIHASRRENAITEQPSPSTQPFDIHEGTRCETAKRNLLVFLFDFNNCKRSEPTPTYPYDVSLAGYCAVSGCHSILISYSIHHKVLCRDLLPRHSLRQKRSAVYLSAAAHAYAHTADQGTWLHQSSGFQTGAVCSASRAATQIFAERSAARRTALLKLQTSS